MLDCCEKKYSTDDALQVKNSSDVHHPVRPISERKVSFHRRFVESQKELKIVEKKLVHAESINKSLQHELSNSVPKEEYQRATSKIEQLQQELCAAKQELQNELEQHKETQTALAQAEKKLLDVEDEMNEMHDSRLDVIDLTRRLELISTDSPFPVSRGMALKYEDTKKDLQIAQTTIASLTAKLERIHAAKIENEEKVKSVLLESKETIDNYEGQVRRQEYELAELQADRLKLQSQLERHRSLLWEMEESRHYNRLRWVKLSESKYRQYETDQDEIIHDMTVEQCKSVVAIESIRRKNRHLETLKTSLVDELAKKNDVICKMSRCGSSVHVSKSMNEEQERTLNMATELSVAYAECQMKVDKLTETVNRLKLEQIQKSDAKDHGTPFRSILKNKSFQLEQSTTSKLDGIKSMSSIFSRSFNTSFIGMDATCDLNQDDARSMSIPRIEFAVSCGNVAGIKVAKVPTVLKNTSIPVELNPNKEKVMVASSFTDKDDVLSGTSKYCDVQWERNAPKDQLPTIVREKKSNDTNSTKKKSLPDGPRIYSI